MRVIFTLVLVTYAGLNVHVCHGRPEPQPQPQPQEQEKGASGSGSSGSSAAPAKAVFGSTFDEIVVETQLAVRPRPRSRAQTTTGVRPVFFRPNATAGAETRRIRPIEGVSVSSSSSSSSSRERESDGISSAARVVGVENPLAAAARDAARARGNTDEARQTQRVRRQWQWPGFDSSSAQASAQGFNNGLFGASSSQSGSQNLAFGPTGVSGSAGQALSQTYQLPGGHTASVSFSNGFNVGPGGPTASNAASLTFSDPSGQQTMQQFFG